MGDEESDITQSFEKRINQWKKKFNPPKIAEVKIDPVKAPIENKPPVPNRFATQKGIQSRDRYQSYETVKNLLGELIPLDKLFARDLANKWELDLCNNSVNNTIYLNSSRDKQRELRMQIDIQKKLPQI